jgi:hypothetical protein
VDVRRLRELPAAVLLAAALSASTSRDTRATPSEEFVQSIATPAPVTTQGGIEVRWYDSSSWLPPLPREEPWLVVSGRRWDPAYNSASVSTLPSGELKLVLSSGGSLVGEKIVLELDRGDAARRESARVVEWYHYSCTMNLLRVECMGGSARLFYEEEGDLLYVNVFLAGRYPWVGGEAWRTVEGTFHVQVPGELLSAVRSGAMDAK